MSEKAEEVDVTSDEESIHEKTRPSREIVVVRKTLRGRETRGTDVALHTTSEVEERPRKTRRLRPTQEKGRQGRG
jgi:hypothetical protein